MYSNNFRLQQLTGRHARAKDDKIGDFAPLGQSEKGDSLKINFNSPSKLKKYNTMP
jgi:hypothetical protein